MKYFMLAVLSLATALTTANARIVPGNPEHEISMEQFTDRQQIGAISPYLRRANDCIVDFVAREGPQLPQEITNLIVEGIPSCLMEMRALVNAYDHIFGEGRGEKFFMDEYLADLPLTVQMRVRDHAFIGY